MTDPTEEPIEDDYMEIANASLKATRQAIKTQILLAAAQAYTPLRGTSPSITAQHVLSMAHEFERWVDA